MSEIICVYNLCVFVYNLCVYLSLYLVSQRKMSRWTLKINCIVFYYFIVGTFVEGLSKASQERFIGYFCFENQATSFLGLVKTNLV